MAKTSAAQLKASKKYISNLGEFKIRCPKEDKEKYVAYAAEHGVSLNQLVIDLLEKEMEKGGE